MTVIFFSRDKKRGVCGCGKPARINRPRLPVSSRSLGRVGFDSQVSVNLLPSEAVARLEAVLMGGVDPTW